MRYVAGKAERLAKKMASMTVPSSASAASSAGDASAAQKKRKGLEDSSTESAEAADSDPQELAGFLDDSATCH